MSGWTANRLALGGRGLLAWLLVCQLGFLPGCAGARTPAEPVYADAAIHDAVLTFLLSYQQAKPAVSAGPSAASAPGMAAQIPGQAEGAGLAVMDRTDSADALGIIEEMTEASEYQALRGVFPILTDVALDDFARKNAAPIPLDFAALTASPRLTPVDYEAGVASLKTGGWRGFKRAFPGVDSVRALSRPGYDPQAGLAIMTVITRLDRERMVALFTLRWIEERWQVLQIAPLAVIMYAKD